MRMGRTLLQWGCLAVPRTRYLLAFAAALAVTCASLSARAGDPTRVWKTIETDHFVVHYYEPLGDVAHRVAVVAERSHTVLAPAMGHEPEEKTQIVLVDDTDSSNGFASVIPRNSIRLFATAPTVPSALNDHDDWLFGLTAHEYTHILHLDSIGGLPRLYNKVVGKTWAPNQIQPRWIVEGIATYNESKHTSGGRTRQALFDMDMRVHTLANKVVGLDGMSNGPRVWPHGNVAYMHGSQFLKYIFDRYGDDKLRELSLFYGSNPLPWGLNRAAERVTGEKFVDLYGDWIAYLREKYEMQLEAIERHGRREGRRLTFSGEVNTDPTYTKDGKYLVWRQSDGLSRERFRAMPVGGNVGRASEYAIIDRVGSHALLADGSIVAAVTERYRSDYAFEDLYIWEHDSKRMRRLTHGLRASDPAVSPDEKQVAFAINAAARRQLAVMPLQPEAKPRIIWSGEDRWDQASSPAWSPDGKEIAFTAWRKGGYRDILIYDIASGKTRALMHDRAQDAEPVYDPRGEYLYYSSDRSGVFNIYAYERATGKTFQVTNVLGCAIIPAVSPDGRRLAYRGFDVGGYDLYEIELVRSRWLEPRLYINTRPAPVDVRNDEVMVSKPRPYRPVETLAPQSYTLQLVTNTFGNAVNVQTNGSDAAGHHGYWLASTLGLDRADVSVGASYSYRRLWPSFSVAAARSTTRRGGVVLDGVNTRYTEENWSMTASLGLPVLRTTDGEGTLSFAYDFDWLGDTKDDYTGPAPDEAVPRFPETDVTIAAASLRFSYSDTRRYVFRLGEIEGQSLVASLRLDHPALGSDFHSLNLDYRWQTFKKLPWGVTPVLSLRIAGGMRTTDRNRSSVYVLGGVPEQDIVRSIVDTLRAGRSGYLRGYGPRAAIGRQYHLANVEYRQELYDFDRGISTLPYYVRRLHFALLLDVGDAYNGSFEPENLKVSVGGALRLDMLFGYFAPAAIDIGYARGLTNGGVGETWLLLTGEL